jgi:hypothetical protein
MRVLVVLVAVAGCDAGAPLPVTPPAPIAISAVDACVDDVALAADGAVVRLHDGTGLAVRGTWFATTRVPANVVPIPPRHDHVDAALVAGMAVVSLHDERGRSLGGYSFAAPACAGSIEDLRWWDTSSVVVAVGYACEQPTCALVAVPIPKDLPAS